MPAKSVNDDLDPSSNKGLQHRYDKDYSDADYNDDCDQ